MKQRQADMEQLRRRDRLILESAGEGIGGVDLQGNITFVNPAGAKMLGWEVAELIGKPGHETTHHSRSDGTPYPVEECPMENSIKRGIPYRSDEETFWRKGGTSFPVTYTSAPLRDKRGEIVGAVVTFQDITERKQAMERYAAILNSALDGFWITDLQGRILEVNDAYCRLTGYSREELLTMSVPDVEAVETPEAVTEHTRRTAEAGSDRFISRHRCKDGRIIAVEISVQYLGAGDGQLVVFIHDITGRLRMEDALRESEELHRQVVDNVTDAIAIAVVGEGRVFANPAFLRLVGATDMSQVIGLPMSSFAVSEDKQLLEERALARARGEPVPSSYEYRFRRLDGEVRAIETSATIINYKGKAASLVVIRDIMERKQAEETIRASLAEKEALLRELHHRVKNNMQVISSLLSLQAQSIENRQAQQLFREAQNRVQAMTLIHEQLYRSENLSAVDMGESISMLAANLYASYGVNTDFIGLRINAEHVLMPVDKAVPMCMIINELVSNALENAFPGGRRGEINIDLHADGDELTLLVRDNGVGFPKDLDLQKAQTLGLQLVNSLTVQLNGSMEYRSEGGAEFKFVFPA